MPYESATNIEPFSKHYYPNGITFKAVQWWGHSGAYLGASYHAPYRRAERAEWENMFHPMH